MIPGYTEKLAEKLGLNKERVALRGKEVMQDIVFKNTELNVNSLLVTPIGICLNYYKESNNFIYVSFNDDNIKLYNNNNLTVTDAAMQTEYAGMGFFPKSGDALNFTVNGRERMCRGGMGEPAVIKVNGKPANLHTPINEGDKIEVIAATKGEPAVMTVGELNEYKEIVKSISGNSTRTLDKIVTVNGVRVTEDYSIQNGDKLEIFVSDENIASSEVHSDMNDVSNDKQSINPVNAGNLSSDIFVSVNSSPIKLTGKSSYVFVDIFDHIDFDRSRVKGNLVTKLNGKAAQYMEELHDGDIIEVFWA